MPTATQTHTTPTQRSTLGFSVAAFAAALATPALAAGVNPDAELIAIGREAAPLVDEFDRYTAAFFALPDGDPGIKRAGHAGDRSYDRLRELVAQAMPLRAATLNGLAAKAILLRHLMLLEFGERHVFVSDETDLTDLTWSLVSDLAGSAVA
jgi:hypothetical protein